MTTQLKKILCGCAGAMMAGVSGLAVSGGGVHAGPTASLIATGAREAAAHGDVFVHVKSSKLRGSNAIAVLVNDQPITNYDIQQRQNMMALGDRSFQSKAQANFKSYLKAETTTTELKGILRKVIDANRGKSREEILAIFEKKKKEFALRLQRRAVSRAKASILPALRKRALEELINERIKLKAARDLNLLVDNEVIDKIIADRAKSNKMTAKQFIAHMRSKGVNISTLKSFYKAELSFRQVVRRRFGHTIAITSRDIDRFVAKTGSPQETTELKLQRILLPISAKVDQRAVTQRLADAGQARAQFAGCGKTADLARNISGASFEDLGYRTATLIAEPTRSLLLNAGDGQMLPPSVGKSGVELWVICGRKASDGSAQKRETAQKQLQQKEFGLLAQRHLKDLRQDAHIEYR